MGDLGSIPRSGRSAGEGNGNPLRYSCLENPMDGGAQVVKNPAASVGDPGDKGSIPGWGRSSPGGHGNPLQFSCLENPMDEKPGRLFS